MKIDLTKYDYITLIDGVKIYSSVDLARDEAEEIYLSQSKRVQSRPDFIIVDVDDGWLVAAPYFVDTRKFERIRRITGYLNGTLDRFNDAKRAEVSERVKHNVTNL